MATTTLPRPSRPPTSPLPSLPVSRSRKSSVSSIHTTENRRDSSASTAPKTPGLRSVSTGIPMRPPLKHQNVSSPTLPTLNGASKSQSPSTTSPPNATTSLTHPLRQAVSIGSFPQPPRKGQRANSHPSSPLANTGEFPKTLRTPSSSHTSRVVPPRTSSKPHPRVSLHKSSSTTSAVSLLSGGEYRSINSATLLSLPASPLSRASSADNLSSTTFEDDGDEFRRGRDMAKGSREDMAHARGKSSERSRRHSAKDAGKGNVIVSVRVRPDIAGNDAQKSELEWMVDGRRSLISYRGKEGGEYYYDNVFAAHDNNAKVYDASAKRLVRRVMEGYHGTVFAYGMTGTGKTFSMQGTATNPGVIPLAITDIFSFIRETPHREFLLRVSYLEIYNEKIHDLLSAPAAGVNGMAGGTSEEIKLREDSKRGVYATPLKEEIVQSPTQLLRVIARGDNARRTGSTQFNARSSRSHAVVQIVVESRERGSAAGGAGGMGKRAGIAPGGVRVSTLSLIDLAGSERAADNKERRTEGAHINKSLLTLGTVIARLSVEKDADKKAEGKEKDGKDGLKHLPYRDSKLTRLLQPALSGNSLVSILCTIQIGSAGSVASAQNHTGETLNTLKFASRAKNNIVSHAKRVEEAHAGDAGSRALLDRYRMEIIELRRQLEEQKEMSGRVPGASGRSHSADAESVVVNAEEERERKAKEEEEMQARHEEQMLEMQLARTALKERIEHLNRLILSSKSIGVNHTPQIPRSVSAMGMASGGFSSRQSVVSAADLALPLSRQPSVVSVRSSSAALDANGNRRLRHSGSGSTSLHSLKRPASASRLSSASTPALTGGAPNSASASPAIGCNASDADSTDSLGSNGDGTASLSTQLHALRADLADKNRYINTLERRLLQARRSSSSRISSGFFGGPGSPAPGASFCVACRELAATKDGKDGAGVEMAFQEKDQEIRELRGRVGDLERMCQALRSRLRLGDLKVDTNDAVGLGLSVASPSSPGVPLVVNKRASVRSRASGTSGGSAGSAAALQAARPLSSSSVAAANGMKNSPVGLLNGNSEKETKEGEERRRGVEEMTRLLDQMITERSRMSFTSLNLEEEKTEGGAVGGATPAHLTEEEEVRVDSGIVVEQ